jgi:hypothetical protein
MAAIARPVHPTQSRIYRTEAISLLVLLLVLPPFVLLFFCGMGCSGVSGCNVPPITSTVPAAQSGQIYGRESAFCMNGLRGARVRNVPLFLGVGDGYPARAVVVVARSSVGNREESASDRMATATGLVPP